MCRLAGEVRLPAVIRSDNGLPFASPNGLFNRSKLSVWWLRLAIAQQEKFDAFIGEFNAERPHEALAMKRPADIYTASPRPYVGRPDVEYPFHDKDVLVTACGRICMHRKKINISTVMAAHRLGIKQGDDGIWLVSFIAYDPGYIDLEQRTLQPLDNPFGTKLSPMS